MFWVSPRATFGDVSYWSVGLVRCTDVVPEVGTSAAGTLRRRTLVVSFTKVTAVSKRNGGLREVWYSNVPRAGLGGYEGEMTSDHEAVASHQRKRRCW
jgi:hypothetical protein